MFMKQMVHEWNDNYDACRVCGATREQIEDNLAPTCIAARRQCRCNECSLIRDCSGDPPRCAECQENIDKHFDEIARKHVAALCAGGPTLAEITVRVLNEELGKRYLTSKDHWYFKPVNSGLPNGKPLFNVCSTCGGTGEIDETLGGISTSSPNTPCPDCRGKSVA